MESRPSGITTRCSSESSSTRTLPPPYSSPHPIPFPSRVPLSSRAVQCFFLKGIRVSDLSLVKGHEGIRPDDLDQLKADIADSGGSGQGGGKGGAKKATKPKVKRVEGSYVVEYAKSGRSTCAVCEEKIERDAVRVGRVELTQNPNFTGLAPVWAHLACTMEREKIEEGEEMDGLEELKEEDQRDVKDTIAGRELQVRIEVEEDEEEEEEKKGKKAKGKGKGKKASKKKRARDEDDDDNEVVEVEKPKKKLAKKAKKSKSEEEDEKEEEEVVVEEEKEQSAPAVDYSSMSAAQLKAACKAAGVSSMGTKAVMIERLIEIDSLRQHAAEEEKRVKTAATSPHAKSASSSSSSSSPPPISSDPVEAEFDRQLREEAALRWTFRDPLKSSLSLQQLKAILSSFGYPTNGGIDRLLDTLTDLMMYGMLPPCPECEKTGIYYKDGLFRCGGFANEWARCSWTATEVEREKFVVPEGYEEIEPFASYKWKAHKKPVQAHQHMASKAAKALEAAVKHADAKEAKVAEFQAKREKQAEEKDAKNVLLKLKFALHGKGFTMSVAELKLLITERGGEVLKAVKGADVLISTEEVVKEGKGKPLKDAAADGIVVLKEDWLHDSLTKGEMQPVKAYTLAQETAMDALTQLIDDSKLEKKAAVQIRKAKSASGSGRPSSNKSTGFGVGKSGKVVLKKGARAAVEGDSGLAESGHVLEESAKEVYSVNLSSADVQTGTNSYYFLQLIEDDSGRAWHIWRKWGRTGTTRGSSKLEAFSSKAEAKAQFAAVYLDKTGNRWSERQSFRKVAGKFSEVETDYSMDTEMDGLGEDDAGQAKSKLPESVQAVVKMFFDVQAMKRTLVEMDIDMDKSAARPTQPHTTESTPAPHRLLTAFPLLSLLLLG